MPSSNALETVVDAPDIPGLIARPLAERDLPALQELVSRSAVVDGNEDDVPDITQWRHDVQAPGVDLALDSLGVFVDTRLIGYGWATARQNPERMGRVTLWGVVDPAHRGRGIGRWILARTEVRAREMLEAVPAGLPSRIDCDADDRLEDRKTLFRAAGFAPIRYFTKMARPLEDAIEPSPLAEGLRVVTWSEELDEATRLAHNDAFQDHFSFEPVPPRIWRFRYAEDPSFLPALSHLAIDGDTVVGYVMSGALEADLTTPGGPQGWLSTIGVRPSHRSRGIASALMTRTMAAFKASGYRRAMLDVDSENSTGALGLYERHGFAPVTRFVLFSKHIEPREVPRDARR